MTDILANIVEKTKERIAGVKAITPVSHFERAATFARTPTDVVAAFQQDGIHIIAEIKFASPSEGIIHPPVNPAIIANGYVQAGAKMLSVLTEPYFFKGDIGYLQIIRAHHPDILILRKDFILDPYQLIQSRAYGVDCVLLIVAILDDVQLAELYAEATRLGLTCLVEVHDAAEFDRAEKIGARMIGINNRNLKTFQIDLNTSCSLSSRKPTNGCLISESGLKDAGTIKTLRAMGFDGFLMGTAFMKQDDPAAALAALQKDLL